MKTWVKNGELLLWQQGYYLEKKDILIEDGVIISLQAPGASHAAEVVIDAAGKLVMPGLINCHTHSYMTLFRNYADDLSFQEWLFERIMPVEDRLQGEDASGIAANTEELTVSISHVADSTRSAAALTRTSDEQAAQGYDTLQALVQRIHAVAEVVSAAAGRITSLQEDSAKISNIVSVIKDIADQTNLLALNAAIEAARAGEQGRGFAVVADEVRKLSERTAHSTNEITSMVAAIQQSTGEVVSEVGNSVNLVNASVADARAAGEAVSGIRQMTQQIAGIVTELSAALQQQSTASTEVAQRIESIVNHAQGVTQTAKRTTSTANTMEQVARDMDQLVSQFQV